MASTMEIVVNAQDNASDVIEGIRDTAGGTASFIEDNWLKIGAVTAGAGAALEGFARGQADTNEAAAQLAASTGETADEIRDLAGEASNVTFPLDEVYASMEAGRQQGLQAGAQLQEFATFWDMVGDASGESGPALADASVALRAVGIEAGDDAEALAALGFVTRETTSSNQEFLQFLERTGPELRGIGADVNDAAAVMGVLESEMGMSGRTARTEFRAAINESDGTLQGLLDTLGVSGDQFAEYQGKVADSSGVIEENAAIHAESYTPLQRLSHQLQETMHNYGGLAQTAGVAAPVLMSVGPVLKGITLATKGLSVAMGFLAANPIVLVVAAVAALVAGLVIAYQKSETFRAIVDGAFRAVGAAGTWVWDSAIKPAFDGIRRGFDSVMVGARLFKDGFRAVMNAAGGFVGLLTLPFRTGVNMVARGVEAVVNGIARAVNRIPSFTIPDWVPGVGGRTFSLPTVPRVALPRLHTGGTFRTATAGGEGLALLADRETVVEPGGVDELRGELRGIRRLLEAYLADPRVVELNLHNPAPERASVSLPRALATATLAAGGQS